jgi:hypothetical protein
MMDDAIKKIGVLAAAWFALCRQCCVSCAMGKCHAGVGACNASQHEDILTALSLLCVFRIA